MELSEAELVLALCERFGCLPSVLYEEDADLMRLLHIEALGRPDDKGD
jgi:hypothetical protein